MADDDWLLTAALVYSSLSLMMGDLKGRIWPNAMLGCLRRRTGKSFGVSWVGTGDRGGDEDEDDDDELARVIALMAGAAYLGLRSGDDVLTVLALVSL